MPIYKAPTGDARFLINEVLRLQDYAALPGFAGATPDMVEAVVEQAGKFCSEVLAPINLAGDQEGCTRHADGSVSAPSVYKPAFAQFREAGWSTLSAPEEFGGQGLPHVLGMLLEEFMSSANQAFAMYPGLTAGAISAILAKGSPEQKAKYVPKMVACEWLGTMNLTEPQCGTDLGLIRTRAVPQADGTYAITGTKIFISSGEHDLAENIIHLVLAKLPDAPDSTKGISLFIVPKVLVNEDGTLGARNAVSCGSIEHKMGIHGNATCVMNYDGATGYLVGEENKGLAAMFIMMNAARLHVALQGIGLLDAAWQKADAYAQERRQMRAPGKGKSAAEADFIAEHPAIRRILDTQRAWVDAGRVLAYKTAIELDQIKHGHTEAQTFAQRWCALVTPIMKSVFTHQAFHGGSDCLQVFGGHGYVREWGIEQIVRDARVAMIYEGTNEIQAIDLLVRKVLADGGQSMNALLDTIAADLPQAVKASTSAQARIQTLRAVTEQIVKAAPQDAALAFRVADDYLRAVALVLMDWAWLRIEAGVDADTPNAETRWLAPAKALRSWVLPEFQMRTFIIVQQCSAVSA